MEKITVIMKSYVPGEDGPIDFLTQGTMESKDGRIEVKYEETGITGLGNTSTTFQIDDKNNDLIINRVGDYNSKLHFKGGEKTYTIYNTPHGDITMEVVTKKLDFNNQFEGRGYLEINLEYDIYINGALNGESKVYIKIKK